jgi:hypothetical protein
MPDVTVILDKKYNTDWKHTFEKKLDEALVPLGFNRIGSTVKEDNTAEIYFRQFGVCNQPERSEIWREYGSRIKNMA